MGYKNDIMFAWKRGDVISHIEFEKKVSKVIYVYTLLNFVDIF